VYSQTYARTVCSTLRPWPEVCFTNATVGGIPLPDNENTGDTPIRRPRSADLYEGSYSRYVRPARADDELIQQLVATIFEPSAPWKSEDPRLVQQLLDRAPQPNQIGVDDWDRPLRADEIAEIWGAPMEGPDTRFGWLRRADEICRAWGKPLVGPGGLRPDLTLPD